LRRILWRKNMTQTRAAPRTAQGPWSALQTILGGDRQQIQPLAKIAARQNRQNRGE
jgi:hypothetical protein